jgi:hypothetical protein
MNPHVTTGEIDAETARRRDTADEQGGVATHYTDLFGIPKDRPELYHWVERRITLHPVNSQIQPIRLENGGSEGLPRTFILCTGSSGETPYMILATRLRASSDWRYRELATGHDAMVTLPDETAELLMEIADE